MEKVVFIAFFVTMVWIIHKGHGAHPAKFSKKPQSGPTVFKFQDTVKHDKNKPPTNYQRPPLPPSMSRQNYQTNNQNYYSYPSATDPPRNMYTQSQWVQVQPQQNQQQSWQSGQSNKDWQRTAPSQNQARSNQARSNQARSNQGRSNQGWQTQSNQNSPYNWKSTQQNDGGWQSYEVNNPSPQSGKSQQPMLPDNVPMPPTLGVTSQPQILDPSNFQAPKMNTWSNNPRSNKNVQFSPWQKSRVNIVETVKDVITTEAPTKFPSKLQYLDAKQGAVGKWMVVGQTIGTTKAPTTVITEKPTPKNSLISGWVNVYNMQKAKTQPQSVKAAKGAINAEGAVLISIPSTIAPGIFAQQSTSPPITANPVVQDISVILEKSKKQETSVVQEKNTPLTAVQQLLGNKTLMNELKSVLPFIQQLSGEGGSVKGKKEVEIPAMLTRPTTLSPSFPVTTQGVTKRTLTPEEQMIYQQVISMTDAQLSRFLDSMIQEPTMEPLISQLNNIISIASKSEPIQTTKAPSLPPKPSLGMFDINRQKVLLEQQLLLNEIMKQQMTTPAPKLGKQMSNLEMLKLMQQQMLQDQMMINKNIMINTQSQRPELNPDQRFIQEMVKSQTSQVSAGMAPTVVNEQNIEQQNMMNLMQQEMMSAQNQQSQKKVQVQENLKSDSITKPSQPLQATTVLTTTKVEKIQETTSPIVVKDQPKNVNLSRSKQKTSTSVQGNRMKQIFGSIRPQDFMQRLQQLLFPDLKTEENKNKESDKSTAPEVQKTTAVQQKSVKTKSGLDIKQTISQTQAQTNHRTQSASREVQGQQSSVKQPLSQIKSTKKPSTGVKQNIQTTSQKDRGNQAAKFSQPVGQTSPTMAKQTLVQGNKLTPKLKTATKQNSLKGQIHSGIQSQTMTKTQTISKENRIIKPPQSNDVISQTKMKKTLAQESKRFGEQPQTMRKQPLARGNMISKTPQSSAIGFISQTTKNQVMAQGNKMTAPIQSLSQTPNAMNKQSFAQPQTNLLKAFNGNSKMSTNLKSMPEQMSNTQVIASPQQMQNFLNMQKLRSNLVNIKQSSNITPTPKPFNVQAKFSMKPISQVQNRSPHERISGPGRNLFEAFKKTRTRQDQPIRTIVRKARPEIRILKVKDMVQKAKQKAVAVSSQKVQEQTVQQISELAKLQNEKTQVNFKSLVDAFKQKFDKNTMPKYQIPPPTAAPIQLPPQEKPTLLLQPTTYPPAASTTQLPLVITTVPPPKPVAPTLSMWDNLFNFEFTTPFPGKKQGNCPVASTVVMSCSKICSSDRDCSGRKKCCHSGNNIGCCSDPEMYSLRENNMLMAFIQSGGEPRARRGGMGGSGQSWGGGEQGLWGGGGQGLWGSGRQGEGGVWGEGQGMGTQGEAAGI